MTPFISQAPQVISVKRNGQLLVRFNVNDVFFWASLSMNQCWHWHFSVWLTLHARLSEWIYAECGKGCLAWQPGPIIIELIMPQATKKCHSSFILWVNGLGNYSWMSTPYHYRFAEEVLSCFVTGLGNNEPHSSGIYGSVTFQSTL